MVRWAESMRAKRLAREREALINTRKSVAVTVLRRYKNESTNYPLKHFFPTIADFCTFPPVREVLELPSEVVVNAQSFLRGTAPNTQSFPTLAKTRPWLVVPIHSRTRLTYSSRRLPSTLKIGTQCVDLQILQYFPTVIPSA